MNGNDHWADAAPLVTKLLADAGYDCGLAGKLHLSGAADRIEPRPDDGYRVFHWSHHPYDDWDEGHDYADWLRAQGQDPSVLFEDPAQIPPYLHQTTWCTDRALEFMAEERSQPWLMSVNYFDPHAAFDPPQPYLDRYDPAELPPPLFAESDLAAQAKLSEVIFQTEATPPENLNMDDYFQNVESGRRPEHAAVATAQAIKAAYYAMIELIDDNVGRLLDALERSGQRENTLVIFMSDHGEMLGDHGLVLKGCRFYEGLVRVPLIFSWPGRIPEGVVCDALVELIDIAPTLLDFCDQAHPARMQGKSLHPILVGEADPNRHRTSGAHRVLSDAGLSGTTPDRARRTWILRHHDPRRTLQVGHLSRPRDRRTFRSGRRSQRVSQPVGRSGPRRHSLPVDETELRFAGLCRRSRLRAGDTILKGIDRGLGGCGGSPRI